MVAFRKLMPVFALVALLLSASSAFAQASSATMQCAVTAGVPPVVRQEGFTELTGDILVTCTGGTQQAPFLANFTVFLNTNITSRLVSGDLSEALLLVDDPGTGTNPNYCVSGSTASNGVTNSVGGVSLVANSTGTLPLVAGTAPGACNGGAQVAGGPQTNTYNVFYGNRTADITGAARENSLTWTNIPVLPPGTNGQRVFRFTNIRANATNITSGGFGLPGQIVAFVSVFPPGGLPLNNPQQIVAYVQPGMAFDTRNCANSDSSSTNIEQCGTGSTSAGRDLFATPTADKTLGSLASFRFREGFSSAFKTRIAAQQLAGNMQPGLTFNTESGYTHTGLIGTTGIADSGTRLAVRFTNVPANTTIFVSTRNISAGNARAILVQTDLNGAGGSRLDLIGPNGAGLPSGYVGPRLLCGTEQSDPAKSGYNPQWPAVAVQTPGGTGLAVWEIVDPQDSSSPSLAGTLEELIFTYGVAYAYSTSAGQPPTLALATANVVGNLAPFYAAANTMSSVNPIPRFITNPATPGQLFRITACQTNLLFPYVTAGFGFDTGLAIANTSEDIFSDPQNRRQEGNCKITYFGSLSSAPRDLVTRTETTARNIRAGETVTWTMSLGSAPDMGWELKGYPNFTGYAIAQCGFRFAHGFAFITDGPIGTAKVAQGYLALVLDGADLGRLRGQTGGEVRGQ